VLALHRTEDEDIEPEMREGCALGRIGALVEVVWQDFVGVNFHGWRRLQRLLVQAKPTVQDFSERQ
jgi:hypothetical protein